MPWTAAHQAPLSMGFSRQEHWSRLPFPPPGDFPKPGIEPEPPVSPTLAGRLRHCTPTTHKTVFKGHANWLHASPHSLLAVEWDLPHLEHEEAGAHRPATCPGPPTHTHTLRQRDSEVHTPTHTCPLMIQSPRPQIYLQDTWQFLDNLTSLHQTENFKEKLANFSEVILFHFFISLKRQAFILNNIILIFFFCNWC